MKAKFSKRCFAYLIDILILSVLLFVVHAIVPENKNSIVLNQQISEIHDQVLAGAIDADVMFQQYALAMHDLDKENILLNLINAFFILGYFVIFPFFFGGQTLGNKKMGIKMTSNDKTDITINQLFIRNIVVNGLLYLLITLMGVYLLNASSYLCVVTICGFVQIGVVIASVFMVLYRKDKCGLQDLWSNSMVILDEEEIV